MGRIKGQHIKATVSWQDKKHPWKSFRGKKPQGGGNNKGGKKVVYQEHHPNKELFPDWTIRLRRNHHLFIWRQVQSLSVNQDTLIDLLNLKRSIQYEIDRRQEILTSLMVGTQSNEQSK